MRKRTTDGNFIPVEVTKTVIERDGSRSITRIDPQKYASKSSLGYNDSFENFNGNGTINLTNQAKRILTDESTGGGRKSSAHDPYSNSQTINGRANNHASASDSKSYGQIEQHKSTTYQTTAHRSSSGAIILNRIATTTTTLPKPQDEIRNVNDNLNNNNSQKNQVSNSKRKIKRIVVKKKNKDGSRIIQGKSSMSNNAANQLLLME